MTRSRIASWATGAVCAVMTAMAALPAAAHGDHESAKAQAGIKESDASAEIKLNDLELVDETGKPVRFVSGALADQIVAIDFIYTTCTTVCPVISSIFADVQSKLGARLAGDVRMISMSIDPVRDTPRRLSTYSAAFDTGADWMWLTGEKSTVDRVLTGLGAYTADIIDHPPMLVIGDAQHGVWRRLFGFPSAEDILAVIDEVAAARAGAKKNVTLGN